MNIITQEDLNDEIKILENDFSKTMKQLKLLNKREKNIKIQNITRDWVECFLDLYQIRGNKVDYNNDPDFLRLTAIRDKMFKLYH